MNKRPCVFLDRDGVLNYDRGDYSWLSEHFKLIPESMEALGELKKLNIPIVVITNQAGISKGLYTTAEMNNCHRILQENCDHAIDHFYYSPYHPTRTRSISRKPGSLMFERAIEKYNCDTERSWMVGDKERDLVPAKKLGIQTILIGSDPSSVYDYKVKDLMEAAALISSNLGS